jgi:polyphosphate:AMP phosphotransferase
MLDIEFGNKLGKSEFDDLDHDLRTRLLAFQEQLKSSGTPLLIVIHGLDGSGKGVLLTELGARMNPRLFRTHSFWDTDSCHESRPFFARYWDALPAKGTTSIHLGAWYERLYDKALRKVDLEVDLETVRNFEQTLADNGMRILKIFMHLDKKTQRERLEEKKSLLSTDSKILRMKIDRSKPYKGTTKIHEDILLATHRPHSPWHVVDATDPEWLLANVSKLILQTGNDYTADPSLVLLPPVSSKTLQAVTDFTKLERDSYKEQKNQLQDRLFALSWKAWQQKRSLILVFEGWDAAGKGGNIRRITEAIDPRLWTVHGSSAPNEVERQYHYLWRYWKTLPSAGKTSIYDRSWYGRVLVERVESFAKEAEWKRAYREINEFESHLNGWGAVILKFWLHISPEEQQRRFENREEVEYKNYKITDEDWRNRSKWDAYVEAADEMFDRTSNQDAPWIIVPADDKYHARITVLSNIVDSLEKRLDRI